jgi:hypothetical protein
MRVSASNGSMTWSDNFVGITMEDVNVDDVDFDDDDEAAILAELQQRYQSYVMEARDFLYHLTGRAMEDDGLTVNWEIAWFAICDAICDVIVDDQTGIQRDGWSADVWRNGYRRDLIDNLVRSLFDNAEAHGDKPPLIDNEHVTVICKTGGGVGLVVTEFDVSTLSRALIHYSLALGEGADDLEKADLRALKRIEAAVSAAQERLAVRLSEKAKT